MSTTFRNDKMKQPTNFGRAWGWNLEEGKVTIGGSGNSPLTFVHRTDIARYIGYVFTRIPPTQLAWEVLRIQGELTVSSLHRTARAAFSLLNF